MHFRPFTSALPFVGVRLRAGTNWSMNVTPTLPAGPAVEAYGAPHVLRVLLLDGSSAFVVGTTASATSTPSTGTITVVALRGQTVTSASTSTCPRGAQRPTFSAALGVGPAAPGTSRPAGPLASGGGQSPKGRARAGA